VDTEPGGSPRFNVAYNVGAVPGAAGTIVELSAPAPDFLPGILSQYGPPVNGNRFTNPLGNQIDRGDNFGMPGSTYHTLIHNTGGLVTLDGAAIGLSVPAGACDAAYQVRVFATDARGTIIGQASNPSMIDYADLSRTTLCNPPPPSGA
jgi:hypothetical protein